MRPAWRRFVAVATLLTLLPMAGGVAAQTDEDAAQRAAREIADARERANQAAEDFFDTESELGLIELERGRLVIELEDLQAEVDRLESDVELIAVNRFVSSGTDGIPLLTDFRTPVDQVQADVLVGVITETGATTLDDYEAARQQLEDKRAELDGVEQELLDTQDRLKELQRVAEDEVERLREIESDRLKDEAVLKALETQQAEEQRQLDELQRRQAAANLQDNPNPGVDRRRQRRTSGDLSTQGAVERGVGRGRQRGGWTYRRWRRRHEPAWERHRLPRRHHLSRSSALRRTATRGVLPAAAAVVTRVSTCSPRPARRCRPWCRASSTHNAHQVLGGDHAVADRRQRQPLLLRPPLGVRGRRRDGSNRVRSSATSATPGTRSAFRTCISRSTRTSVSR